MKGSGTTAVQIARITLRLLGLVPVFLFGILIGFVLLLASVAPRVRDWLGEILSRQWFTLLLWVFGTKVREIGAPSPGPVLLAANHVSWMDIVLLGSRVGACFVSKSEVADWPVLGWLAKQGGTLFIHRGHRDSAERIAHEMADHLLNGKRLLFFPEGTTTDGWQVQRFKYRLFVPAVQTATPVQPVTICYELEADGDPLAYIHGISFVASVFGVMLRARTEVMLYWNEPIMIDGHDKREIAAEAGRVVTGQMEMHRGGSTKLLTGVADGQTGNHDK